MIKVKIIDYLKKIIKEDIKIEVFSPEQEQFGHYSTNVALKLAKIKGKNPMAIAEEIKISLQQIAVKIFFKKIEIATPGFINFWLSEKTLQNELKEILKKKKNYGIGKKQKEKIQIEYISANPTGSLTLANGRGGFFGDVLSNILEFYGYKVEREYYINDTGNQVLTLGKSILANIGFIPFEEKFYKGKYVKEWAAKNSLKIKKFKNNPMKVGQLAAKDFLKEIKSAIKKSGINFDRWTSEEKDIHRKNFVKKALEIFKKSGLTYEQDGALWLKTSSFNDEKDRVLITKDNFPTYFLADSGHYLETKNRGFRQKIMILGPDHHGYVKRIQAAARIIGFKKSEVIITQAVRLISRGQEIKMSKRKGEFITFDELISEVGKDSSRFFFLMHSPDSHMDFDLDLAKEQSIKNPVYYAQYASVRCKSILKKSKINSLIGGQKSKVDLSLLNTEEDIKLMRILVKFSETLDESGQKYSPQILARYSLELAKQFHNFYEKERIIGENIDKNLSLARLELIKATQIIFKTLFNILRISNPDKMQKK